MPLKPDKFAIRFYAVVGWESLYVHSFWDNGSGNTMPTTAAQRYTHLFPSLRHPLHVTLNRPDIPVDPKAAAALWVAMIAHQTKLHQSTTGRRLVVSDNVYTRHALARAVFEMTDGDVRMLGTVRQDWVGRLNRVAVGDSMKRVAQMPRGSWELIAAVDSELDSKQARAAHARRKNNFLSTSRRHTHHRSSSRIVQDSLFSRQTACHLLHQRLSKDPKCSCSWWRQR